MSIKFSRDAYELDEDSDQECAESSDDDIDEFLRGTFQQQRKMLGKRRSVHNDEESLSEDEFEKEMAAELNNTMKKIEADRGLDSASRPAITAIEEGQRYYENDYFDSDSDEEATSAQKRVTKHPILSNDDLLYDPEMDEDDQRWVDKQRRQYLPKTAGSKSDTTRVKPLPNSDAVLNCPCCMTLLCMDCQRHDIYQHQYRAMFVTNCTVRSDQTLRYPDLPTKDTKRKGKKSLRAAAASSNGETSLAVGAGSQTGGSDAAAAAAAAAGISDESYHPVVCSICNSEVGVYDTDEVYHFFNVLSSHT